MLSQKAAFELFEERKLLGVCLSSHPVRVFSKDVERFSNAKLAELPKLVGQSDIMVVAILVDYFEMLAKDGSKMMILRFEDDSGMTSLRLFANEIPPEVPPVMTPVVVKFKVQRGFEQNPPRTRMEQMWTLEDFRKQNVKKVRIEIASNLGLYRDWETAAKIGRAHV